MVKFLYLSKNIFFSILSGFTVYKLQAPDFARYVEKLLLVYEKKVVANDLDFMCNHKDLCPAIEYLTNSAKIYLSFFCSVGNGIFVPHDYEKNQEEAKNQARS